MLIDVSAVVDCLNLQPITVLLSATGGANNLAGQWESGGPATEIPDVQADVQPASGRILQKVPEGQRATDHVTVFLTKPILDTVNELTQKPPDQIVYRGVIWKNVAVIEDWQENGFAEYLFQTTKIPYPTP